MKLSDELKQLNDSGDVGSAVEGLSERAQELEDTVFTKREQIAVEAMKSLIIILGYRNNGVDMVQLRRDSYDFADAMLAPAPLEDDDDA